MKTKVYLGISFLLFSNNQNLQIFCIIVKVKIDRKVKLAEMKPGVWQEWFLVPIFEILIGINDIKKYAVKTSPQNAV